MNDRLHNQLDMIGTLLTVADQPGHKAVWQGQSPADFGTDLAALQTEYGATAALAAQLATTPTGTAEEKDVAETALEALLHMLCRALAVHLKKRATFPRAPRSPCAWAPSRSCGTRG